MFFRFVFLNKLFDFQFIILSKFLQIKLPGNFRLWNKLVYKFLNFFDSHPKYRLNLFFVNFYLIILVYSFNNKKNGRNSIFIAKLYFFLALNSFMNIDSSLLVNFSSCTLMRTLLLIPFSFWKSKFLFIFNYQNFCIIWV